VIRTRDALLLLSALSVGCSPPEGGAAPDVTGPGVEPPPAQVDPPNVVVILTDDQGFGDLGCYGHPSIRTPHVDRLAAEGARFTSFYAGSPVCSPSRVALLTGCYPKRVGMQDHVVKPASVYGLHPQEVTLAEVLKEVGYATGMVGKWHLGHRLGLLPLDQGFDTWFGVPYSNDMSRAHRSEGDPYAFHLPLIRDREVVEWEPDQRQLTRRYTEAAVEFIDAHHGERFFLYLAHSMPHTPLVASEDFAGRSAAGLYGDVIEELDWSTGEVVDALERHGILDETLVLFLSDNGPNVKRAGQGGSAGDLRGGKGMDTEGGHRVPAVLRFPALVPAATVSDELLTAMDVLPTVASLAGTELPPRELDGHDVRAQWSGKTGPERPYLYYGRRGGLQGIRRGSWKLSLLDGALYDLDADPGEDRDLAREQTAIAEELGALARELDAGIEGSKRPVKVVNGELFDPVEAR